MKISILLMLPVWLVSFACTPEKPATPQKWAIAIHGGAGVISKDLPADIRDGYLQSLEEALTIGRDLLDGGASSLDAVVKVVQYLEEDPRFNAGRGAVYTNDARHELDASIMDGATLAGGAVAGVTTVKSPVELARMVMDNTRHVLLAGAGAERFADEMGVERVPNSYFNTDHRRQQLDRVRSQTQGSVGYVPPSENDKNWQMGTVGAVALDRNGNLAAATSTGGMTNKRFGRIGDSPILGAGTYANNATCAVSATGTGEEFIRHAVAFHISALMKYQGATLHEAAEQVIHGVLQPGDGGIIAVSNTGDIAMVFNSPGMFRGAANAQGRFEVAIWD